MPGKAVTDRAPRLKKPATKPVFTGRTERLAPLNL
jgi:hypothetical protein